MKTYAASQLAVNSGGRLDWVDALKGFGIILVVLGHTVRGVDVSGLMEPQIFHIFDRCIYAFHMPLFFVISGLFFLDGLSKRRFDQILWRLVLTLLYPMVLWTYLFLATKALAGGMTNDAVAWRDVFIFPFPGQLHLWFLWALFLVQAFILLCAQLLGPIPRPIWLIGMCALAAIGAMVSVPEPWDHWFRHLPRYLPFFVAGMILGTYRRQLGTIPPAGGWVAALVFVALLVAVPQLPYFEANVFSLSSVLVASVFVIAMAFRGCVWMGWLAPLGAASMAIYLMHTIFAAGLREGLLAFGIESAGLHIVLGSLIGLSVPLAIYHLWVRSGWGAWFGWR